MKIVSAGQSGADRYGTTQLRLEPVLNDAAWIFYNKNLHLISLYSLRSSSEWRHSYPINYTESG
jgi:hypothetical protein